MKTPLTTRTAAFVLSALMTLISVHLIADYALPEPADVRLALAPPR